MASEIAPLEAKAVAYVRGMTTKLYKASGKDATLRDAALACGINVDVPSWYCSHTCKFAYIVAVTDATLELAAILGVSKDDDGDLDMEFESFTEWEGIESTTNFVKTNVSIDIDPALLAATVAALPRGIGTISVDRSLLDKLYTEEWETLGATVDELHSTITI